MSKDLFKEAIADAKAVREAALANAKAALEESMTPKLQSMIAAKLQEMEIEEELDESEVEEGFDTQSFGWDEEDKVTESDELEEDFDLSEILAELEEESLNEAKEEDEEEEKEEEEEMEVSDEEEVDLSDPDSLKAFVEKIVQDAISQMDAGAEPEGEESMDLDMEPSDDESITVDENQEINLEEILNEIEMEENLYEENLYEGPIEGFVQDPKVQKALIKAAKGEQLTPEDVKGIDMKKLQAALQDLNAKASSLEEDLNEEQIPQWMRSLEQSAGQANQWLQQNVVDLDELTLPVFVLVGLVAISTAIGLTVKGPKKEELNLQKPLRLNLRKNAKPAAAKAAIDASSAPAPVKSVAASILSKLQKAKAKNEGRKKKVADEKDEKDLKEALRAINTLKSELNEVNLLNAKLIYVNKIFRAKNLTESQKIEVLASFDKATTVKEAQLVFESLNSTLNTTVKKQIKESLGFASKAAGVAPTKRTIVESDDVIARMQRLANIK